MMFTRIFKHLMVLLILGLGFIATPASAAVELSFYSKEFGSSFPHAFVVFRGKTEAGVEVRSDYGFTASSITPAILAGSVRGEIMSHPAEYIAASDRQITMTLTDRQYEAAMEVVHRWRTRKQPSYNLNRANCVHFVAEIAQAVGLTVRNDPKLMKKPRSFLTALRNANAVKLGSR
jgi:hypothetical protein